MAKVIELRPEDRNEAVRKASDLYLANKYAEAGALAETHLMEHPEDAQALSVLAAVMKQANRPVVAYHLAKRAVELRPERSETWLCLGHMAQALWRADEALSAYKKALQRAVSKHQKALQQNNVAACYLDLGQFAKAEEWVDQSLANNPEDANTRHNKGLCLLARRQWHDAWGWYSCSIGSANRSQFRYGKEPEWDGVPFPGILVIYGEQGLGDEITAASVLPQIIRDQQAAGGRVIIDCDARLKHLFSRSFPGATVYGDRWNKELHWPEGDRDIGASISAFETLKFYRDAPEKFPGTPYLTPCPDRTEMWREKFAKTARPTIGIAWTGGTWKNAGSFRNLPLPEWAPIFAAVDANWVSLQYKDARTDIAGTPVVQYPWATLTKDYDDTAALVAACDLVLAMQTSVCHVAGAMGVPTWTILPRTSQWRYGEAYDDLPWFASVRLYRQKGERWPVGEVATALKARFAC